MRKWVRKYGVYIIAVAAGAAITPAAIRTATLQRGYKAIGGEYLIIPLAVLIVYLVQEVKQTVTRIMKEE
ncbi:hypothetical protein TthWC1_2280 [Thermoanaerobacter thermohydrosulfuricus WC1]|uniref:Uncharacterized protein n=1 Tax=Thermoanaerobacter thermohydrosulfuricus WC1 TaxID=1198630 RepID=M8CV13_THETY|nr:hypothetical protein [Thermoanaerobacter thermohydrosulfuricus]EMT38193.1 hypothetical protein TthWC1_2280 [Thermoanaerobacter thermohydrosulfuricus WC1]